MNRRVIKTRYRLSKKDVKKFLEKVKTYFGEPAVEILANFKNIEKIETRLKDASVYLFDKKPIFLEYKEGFFPTILHANIFKHILPVVIVDMGAVPHIVNGADVMAPGIRKTSKEFSENEIVLVADEEKERIFCVGKALMSSNDVFSLKRGRAIKNLHHVKDAFWDFLLSLRT